MSTRLIALAFAFTSVGAAADDLEWRKHLASNGRAATATIVEVGSLVIPERCGTEIETGLDGITRALTPILCDSTLVVRVTVREWLGPSGPMEGPETAFVLLSLGLLDVVPGREYLLALESPPDLDTDLDEELGGWSGLSRTFLQLSDTDFLPTPVDRLFSLSLQAASGEELDRLATLLRPGVVRLSVLAPSRSEAYAAIPISAIAEGPGVDEIEVTFADQSTAIPVVDGLAQGLWSPEVPDGSGIIEITALYAGEPVTNSMAFPIDYQRSADLGTILVRPGALDLGVAPPRSTPEASLLLENTSSGEAARVSLSIDGPFELVDTGALVEVAPLQAASVRIRATSTASIGFNRATLRVSASGDVLRIPVSVDMRPGPPLSLTSTGSCEGTSCRLIFSASVADGFGPVSVAWGGCAAGTGPEQPCSSSIPGTLTATAAATDAYGATSTASLSHQVVAASYATGAWSPCVGEGDWVCSGSGRTGCHREGQQTRAVEVATTALDVRPASAPADQQACTELREATQPPARSADRPGAVPLSALSPPRLPSPSTRRSLPLSAPRSVLQSSHWLRARTPRHWDGHRPS